MKKAILALTIISLTGCATFKDLFSADECVKACEKIQDICVNECKENVNPKKSSYTDAE